MFSTTISQYDFSVYNQTMVLDIYGNFVSRNNPFLDVIRELDKRKDVKINLMGPVHPSLLYIQKRKYIAGDIAIGFGTPRDFLGMLREQYRLKLGYISWETTKVPYGSLYGSENNLKKLDLLILPNKWNWTQFAPVGIPMAIVDLPYSHWVEPSVRANDKTFTYLMEGTLMLKHNVGLVLSAFLSLYKDRDDVRLILKTDSGTLGHLQFPYKNIEIIDRLWSTQETQKLYDQADVFVYPASAESYPIPLLNAIAAGIPTISPTHSNFHDLGYAQLVNNTKTPAKRYSEKLGDVGDYWAIDYEELKTLMRQLYNAMPNNHRTHDKFFRQTNSTEKFVDDIINLTKD